MSVIINIKDGSIFEIKLFKMRSISVDKKFLTINYKNDDIKFETKLLESFTNKFPRSPGEISTQEMILINNLTTILTTILQNQE